MTYVDFAQYTGVLVDDKIIIPTKIQPKTVKIKKSESKYFINNQNIIYNDTTMEYYKVLRRRKMDPIFNQELKDENSFQFKYMWDPYTGEILKEDPYGPLYFHPDNLIRDFYVNRLRGLWIEDNDEANGYYQGYYDTLVGIGDDFHIVSRGHFPERYLFRLPTVDCYLTKDHDERFITLGPKLTDNDAKEIDRVAMLWGDYYKRTYHKERPSLYKIKQLYDQAISKCPEIGETTNLPLAERNKKYSQANMNAVDQLRQL